MERDEKDIVEKALRRGTGYKKIPYHNEQDLIDDVKQLYPAATTLIMLNPNDRDTDDTPLFHVKTLRKLTITITKKQLWNGHMQAKTTAKWKEVFAWIENDYAVLKVSNHSIGEAE